MNNTINVNLEFCPEDRARLDKLWAALKAVVQSPVGKAVAQTAEATAQAAQAAPEPEKTEAAETVPAEQEKPADVNPAPETEDKKEAPTVSLSDVQQKVVILSSAGKKAEVRAIVKKYADRVSGIPEDKLAEVFEALKKLEG